VSSSLVRAGGSLAWTQHQLGDIRYGEDESDVIALSRSALLTKELGDSRLGFDRKSKITPNIG